MNVGKCNVDEYVSRKVCHGLVCRKKVDLH